MQRSAVILTRLRLGFVLLGAALLLPLGLLARSMHAKLEAQHRLRHEIVAERIFDEMERELTQLLQRETERPTAAYEAQDTLVSNWAPFVVGYYTRDAAGTHIVAEQQLSAERAQRLRSAVSGLPALGQARASAAPKPEGTSAEARQDALHEPVLQKGEGGSAPAKAAPEAVLKQLNRSVEERERTLKRKATQKKSWDRNDDPLAGVD